MNKSCLTAILLTVVAASACSSDEGDDASAAVQLKNDFNNPELARQPPWTICESSYRGVDFGELLAGETSAAESVPPGLDYVLMVAAWDDPSCALESSLPIASRNEEEVVEGQTRIIAINLPNHQGPCPPEGIQPIPEELYNRILELWPEYGFRPYAERTQNTQCLPEDDSGAGGAGGNGSIDGAAGNGGAGGA